MKRAIVVGGGATGCTWARLLALRGWRVDLVERDRRLGGGCKTLRWGGHPFTFGPRHLFTPHEDVFRYYDALVPQRRLAHYLLTYVERDGQFYSYPLHADDVERMSDRKPIEAQLAERRDPATARNFEEYWIYSVGEILYEKFVKTYSEKMWQIESNALIDDFKFDGKGVGLQTGRSEVRPDYFISYPIDLAGWDAYFDICARTPGVRPRLETCIEAFDLDRRAVRIGGAWETCDLVVSSISPDVLFERQWGELEYVGRDFIPLVLPVEQAIPDPTFFLHYPNSEIFTRVVEYKKLTGYKAPTTLLGMEVPSKRNKLYPYPIKAEQAKAQRYIDALPDGVLSVGRMGNYRYMDIAMVTKEAFVRIDEL